VAGLYDVKQELLVANPSSSVLVTSWASLSSPVVACSSAWQGVSCIGGAVSALDLSSLTLAGSLPSSLSLLTSLSSLKLSGNSFASTLPAAWSSLSRVTLLSLGSNLLTGTLPAAWSSLSALSQLSLSVNALSGTLPPSWPVGMTSLSRLVASSNAGLCGSYPGAWSSTLVSSSGTGLGTVCSLPPQLSGLLTLRSAVTLASWPSGLTGWTNSTDPCVATWTGVSCAGTKITSLDLSFYSMNGTLPTSMSLVTGLQTLSLGGNT
jgi:hypothetical protein